jgi:hypothetical protein
LSIFQTKQEPKDGLEEKGVSNFKIKWEPVQIRETVDNGKKNFNDNDDSEDKIFDDNNDEDSSIIEETFVKEEPIDFS